MIQEVLSVKFAERLPLEKKERDEGANSMALPLNSITINLRVYCKNNKLLYLASCSSNESGKNVCTA